MQLTPSAHVYRSKSNNRIDFRNSLILILIQIRPESSTGENVALMTMI